MDTGTVAVVGFLTTISGVLITAYFNMRNAQISKKSEERRHLRELIVGAAIENWKHTYTIMDKHETLKEMYPLDIFIIHMVKLSEILTLDKITPDTIKDKLKEAGFLVDSVAEYFSQRPKA